jgi:hypothetical protein
MIFSATLYLLWQRLNHLPFTQKDLEALPSSQLSEE